MKKKNLTITIMTILVAAVLCLSGCTYGSDTANKESNYSLQAMTEAFDTVGLPELSNYYERAQLKEIYELRDDPNLICYWYVKNDMTGKLVYMGRCVGYGIPYSASLTAPNVPDYSSYEDNANLCQAEPNGIYTNGVTSSATWILTVNEEGDITPSYVEFEITVTQTKIAARLCEDWSLTENYTEMPDTAEIDGTVDTSKLENTENELSTETN